MTQRSEEIDLLALFAKIVRSLRSNALTLIIAFVFGIALGFLFYKTVPREYESKMILLSDILTSSYSERITENLNNLIREKNTKLLAERLAITEAEAGMINRVEIESFIQEKGSAASESSTFLVTVKVSDNQLFPKLQEGIVNYLRSNEFVKIRVEQRLKFNNFMIEKIKKEIRSLDSLKTRLFLGQPVYSKSAEMLLVDPTSIYTTVITLNKDLINYQNNLELVNSIQLVEGFTILQKPSYPKLSVCLASGAGFGLFFAILLLLLKALRALSQFADSN